MYKRIRKHAHWLVLWLLAVMLPAAANSNQAAPPVRAGNILDQVSQWERSGWKPGGTLVVDEQVHHGSGSSYKISASAENDLRFVKSIKVYAGRFYRFSAQARTEAVKGEVGANLSVYGTFGHSRPTLRGNNDWKDIEQVFRALEDGEAKFALRLGYWDATATGTAWFDDVRLEELADWQGAYEPILKPPSEKGPSSAPLRVFNFLFFLPFLGAYLILLRRQALQPCLDGSRPERVQVRTLWVMLALAVLARVAFASYMGFAPQLAQYKGWALSYADPARLLALVMNSESGLSSPFWMYWLSFVGLIVKTHVLEASPLFTVLLKFPGIAAEMCLISLLLIYLSRQVPANRFSWQAYFIALNPAFIMVTAFWGEPIAISGFFACMAVWLACRSRPVLAGLALGCAILGHLQALILAPIIGWMLLCEYGRRQMVKFLCIALAIVCVFCLPLIGLAAVSGLDINHLPLQGQMHSIATALSQQFAPLERRFVDGGVLQSTVLYGVLLLMVVIFDRWRQGRWANSQSVESYFALCYMATLLAAVLLPWSKDISLYLALVSLVPLLSQGRRYRWGFLLVSILLLLKPVYLFSHFVIRRSGVPEDSVLPFVAVTTVVVLIAIEIACRLPIATSCLNGLRGLGLRWHSRWCVEADAPGKIFSLSRWDYCAIVVIWLLGLSLVLFNIGDRLYPTAGYRLTADSEMLEVELMPGQQIDQVRVYTGINGTGVVRFEYRAGESWRPLWPENGGSLKYIGSKDFYSAFKVLVENLHRKEPVERLRITLMGRGFDVNELALIGSDGKPLMPAKVIQRDVNEKVWQPQDHPLFNEQDQITDETGYRARAVWDEVSLARSAQEMILGVEPFERAHPPLGKTLIGLGIRLFDMTPFGWRFMDALAVAAFPVLLFVGGRWMTGRRIGAYLAAVLAVFELMFYIHGRWANIDTFMALFLTASLLALYRWYMLGQGRFIPGNRGWFFLAGLLFGLAASVKWNALFIGFALVIMLAGAKVTGFTEALRARRAGAHDAITDFWRRDLLPSMAYWALAFLLLPAAVYYFSHFELVHTMPGKPTIWSVEGVRAFISQQSYAWNYHADRDATHGGSSLFFTWPILWQPMWMYTPSGIPAGYHASLALMGNPVIWWTGFAVMLGIGWSALAGRDKVAICLAGLYFLQCLPWLLVTRTSFIYHYYPFLPLLMLGIAYAASRLDYGKWLPRIVLGSYLILVIAGFVLYFPMVTATPVPQGYIDSLRLFDTWSVL